MNKVRVVSMINDIHNTTLYLDGASPITLPTSRFRTQAIIDEITPVLALRKIAEVDLDKYTIESAIEKKSNGLMRFMKVAGSKLTALFSRQNVNEAASEPSYEYHVDLPEETTVAVVDGKEIPGVEFLEKHMEHAVSTDNIVGLQRFMERIAAVVDARGHTVQELLRFMEKGDLPIADDGSIIAYKILKYDPEHKERFVDCHSKKVSQTVGSRVSMDAKLVDPSRRVECSSGLHIARRGYIRSFSGELVVLVKIAPEDVIAVPRNEPNKMRCCAYHIVAQLDDAAYDLLRKDESMTTNEKAARILANVIKGNHVGVTEHVVIHGAKGDGVVIEKTLEEAQQVIELENIKADSLDKVETLTKVATPRQINDRARATREQAARSGDMSAALFVAPTADPEPVPNAETVKALKDSRAGNVKRVETVGHIIPAKIKTTDNADRDAKVLKLIADGKTQQQAAEISGVNYRTVRRIVARSKA
jgi:hypothetical protein